MTRLSGIVTTGEGPWAPPEVSADRPAKDTRRAAAGRIARHWPLFAVLATGGFVRVLFEIAYWPALTYGDTWAYLRLAYQRLPFGLQDDRPSGYPLMIRLIRHLYPFHDIGTIIILQHLAGLAVGLLLYLLLVRLRVRPWLAAIATLVVLLDAYTIAVEQYIAPQAFFSILVFGAVFVATVRAGHASTAMASGLMIGVAATLWTAALFVMPIWLIYVVWVRRNLWVPAVALVALALVPVAYSGYRYAEGDSFGLTRADGWFLYARVASVVDGCDGYSVPAGTEPLCARPSSPASHETTWYLFSLESPARFLFPDESPAYAPTSNQKLRAFSLAVIRARPLAYAEAVLTDLGSYVSPAWGTPQTNGVLVWPVGNVGLDPYGDGSRQLFLPNYPNPLDVRPPADALVGYWNWAHLPGWLGALLAILGLAIVVTGRRPRPAERGSPDRRAATFLLVGTGLALVVVTVAVAAADLRYLAAATPPLTGAGAVAVDALLGHNGRRWSF